MKKSRIIRSFEPDPDVGEMLEKALQAGLVMGDILNEATRKCGPDIIEKMANERLKNLQALSFENPQLMMAGVAA